MQNLSLDIVEGRDHVHHRAVGRRQVHDPAADQRPQAARQRARVRQGPGHHGDARARSDRSAPHDRLRVPVLGAVRLALDRGEHRAAAARAHEDEETPRSARSSARRLKRSGWRTSKNVFPRSCPGGMVKRAGFARAVVTNPQAVLYDEPTTGLDPIITHVLTETIRQAPGATQRNGRRGIARSGEHLPDGGLHRHAVRRRDRRVRNRGRDSQVTQSDRAAILARERSRADSDLTS